MEQPVPEAVNGDLEHVRRLMSAIHQMVDDNHEPLIHYDTDAETSDADATGTDVGVIRIVGEDVLGEGQSAEAAIYSEDGRQHMGSLLRPFIDVDALPLGHVEVAQSYPNTSLNVVMYVFENGTIAARMEGHCDLDEALSDESKECFELARELGLGSEWTEFMFDTVDEVRKLDRVVTLDQPAVNSSIDFLNGLAEQV